MSITYTRYFKRESDGSLLEAYSYAEIQNALARGFKNILRKEYRELKREAKRIQDNIDWYEVSKQAAQITPQQESEFHKKFESDRFYFGESGMSGE